MAHSHSYCPVCNHQIQDLSSEKCDKCGWIIAVESRLESKYYDLLSDWGARYYEKIIELEGRNNFRQRRLEKRLWDHRDDIIHLQKQMDILCNRVPEIKSILESNDVNIAQIECTLAGSKEGNNDRDRELELPLDLNIKTDAVSSVNRYNTCTEKIKLPQIHQSIKSEYYHNISQFMSRYNAINVSVNRESIDRNRGNEDKTVIFEEVNRGNYWLFSLEEIIYLVPTDKYINQHSYTNTSLSFDCHRYTPDYQKIQLVKPAIVSIDPNTHPQTWRLQQRGELVFL